MSKSARLIVAAILIAVAFFGESILESVKNIDIKPNPTPENVVNNNVTPPSVSDKQLTVKIQSMDIDSADAKEIEDFYCQLRDQAMTIEFGEIVKNLGAFRDFNMKSGRLNFSTRLRGKYPELGEAIDNVFIMSIGSEDVAMTPELQKRIAEVCNAIAWAVSQ